MTIAKLPMLIKLLKVMSVKIKEKLSGAIKCNGFVSFTKVPDSKVFGENGDYHDAALITR